MTFLLNFVGFIVAITGLAWLATLVGISQAPVTIGAAILLAVAALVSIASSRPIDPA
jgi:hypothetical protein